MTPADLTLARRAVACAGWRWMPGMRHLIPSGWDLPASGRVPDGVPNGGYYYPDSTPDLTDPATLGCLLALVREAHGDPEAFARREIGGPGWVVIRSNSVRPIRGDTEAAALVAALEAACRS